MSQFEVTISSLKSKAEELSTQNTQLKTQIEKLEQTEQSLSSMWEGEAKAAFRNAFQRDMTQIRNFYNAIQQYVQVLNNIAARYAQAESQNVNIANTRKY